MSTVDPHGRTDQLDNATLEALVKRFEARGKNQQFSKMLQEYLEAMHIDNADYVLTWAVELDWRPERSRFDLDSPEKSPELILVHT